MSVEGLKGIELSRNIHVANLFPFVLPSFSSLSGYLRCRYLHSRRANKCTGLFPCFLSLLSTLYLCFCYPCQSSGEIIVHSSNLGGFFFNDKYTEISVSAGNKLSNSPLILLIVDEFSIFGNNRLFYYRNIHSVPVLTIVWTNQSSR